MAQSQLRLYARFNQTCTTTLLTIVRKKILTCTQTTEQEISHRKEMLPSTLSKPSAKSPSTNATMQVPSFHFYDAALAITPHSEELKLLKSLLELRRATPPALRSTRPHEFPLQTKLHTYASRRALQFNKKINLRLPLPSVRIKLHTKKPILCTSAS